MFPVRLVQLSLAGMALVLANAAAAADFGTQRRRGGRLLGQRKLASDAIFLAAITGERRLAVLASGALGWIAGLNTGVPRP